jgi:hypothetical protein
MADIGTDSGKSKQPVESVRHAGDAKHDKPALVDLSKPDANRGVVGAKESKDNAREKLIDNHQLVISMLDLPCNLASNISKEFDKQGRALSGKNTPDAQARAIGGGASEAIISMASQMMLAPYKDQTQFLKNAVVWHGIAESGFDPKVTAKLDPRVAYAQSLVPFVQDVQKRGVLPVTQDMANKIGDSITHSTIYDQAKFATNLATMFLALPGKQAKAANLAGEIVKDAEVVGTGAKEAVTVAKVTEESLVKEAAQPHPSKELTLPLSEHGATLKVGAKGGEITRADGRVYKYDQHGNKLERYEAATGKTTPATAEERQEIHKLLSQSEGDSKHGSALLEMERAGTGAVSENGTIKLPDGTKLNLNDSGSRIEISKADGTKFTYSINSQTIEQVEPAKGILFRGDPHRSDILHILAENDQMITAERLEQFAAKNREVDWRPNQSIDEDYYSSY